MRRQPALRGLGIGWRPELALAIARRPDLAFVEVLVEALNEACQPALEDLRARGTAIIPHGVALGLGDAHQPERHRLARLARLVERYEAPFVSEHVAFVRARGREAGHLLPVPRTREMLEVMIENVLFAKRRLPVPLALENVAPLFDWPGAELTEAAFLTELLERTDCGLVLDLANLHAREVNLGEPAIDTLARLPLERIAYVHVGGGVMRDGRYHDTHAHALDPAVLALVAALAKRVPDAAMMLERDANFPTDAEIWAELAAIGRAAGRPDIVSGQEVLFHAR